MTEADLKMKLTKLTAHRKSRLNMADEILENPALFDALVEYVFEEERKIAVKAAWVFEFVCLQNIGLLNPRLDYFTKNLPCLKEDGGIRPVSKVCEHIAKTSTSASDSKLKKELTDTQIERIVETAFDWLLGPYKVAVKVFAMSTLFYFGKTSNWIHNALVDHLEKEMPHRTAAFQARGKKILRLINQK